VSEVSLTEHNNVVKAFPSDRADQPFSISRMVKKLKLQERRAVIPSRRSLTACRPLRFLGRSMAPIADRRAKGGETHGAMISRRLSIRLNRWMNLRVHASKIPALPEEKMSYDDRSN